MIATNCHFFVVRIEKYIMVYKFIFRPFYVVKVVRISNSTYESAGS